jgi:hypothetical protein
MALFALIFALFFLIFWISFPQNRLPGLFSISLALLTGVGVALIRYLTGAEPRFHDFERSLYGTALLFSILPPVVLPSAVFVLLRRLRVLSPMPGQNEADGCAAWLLLALVPYCAVFALVSAEPGTVKQLVLLPLLWVIQIITIHFFAIRVMGTIKIFLRILFAAAALAVPFLCAAVYRAWVAKELVEALLFLLPLAVVFVLYFLRHIRAKA